MASGTNASSCWADEVAFSVPKLYKTSPKYLIASTRSRDQSNTGYISAFALDPQTGAIATQLFIVPSSGSGGLSNSVSPSPFNEKIFGIADSVGNYVEVWEIDRNGTNATPVARAYTVSEPANIIWYN